MFTKKEAGFDIKILLDYYNSCLDKCIVSIIYLKNKCAFVFNLYLCIIKNKIQVQ